MTARRDPDRIMRAWLDLMPDEAPDRALAAVLQAVERTPQVRRPLARSPWRLLPMNRLSIAAAIAALVILVAGGSLWLGRSSPAIVSAPTASPVVQPTESPSASSSPVQGVIPDTLQHDWVAGPVSVTGLDGPSEVNLHLTSDSFALSSHAATALLSSIASASGSTLNVTTEAPASTEARPCAAGTTGTYSWSLSAGGTNLTIGAGTDTCPERAAALPGTWHRSVCKGAGACLGDLEAGTYQSQFIDPRLHPESFGAWVARYGNVNYTVPDGWSNSSDWPSSLSLTPSADYALETKDGPPTGTSDAVILITQPAVTVQDGRCSGTVDAAASRTVDGIVTAIRKMPGIVSTAPTPITIDGYPGTVLDLTLKPGWTATCPGDTDPSAEYLAMAGTRADSRTYGLFDNEQQRLILLDLGTDDVLAILVDSRPASRFDELATASCRSSRASRSSSAIRSSHRPAPDPSRTGPAPFRAAQRRRERRSGCLRHLAPSAHQ